MNTCANPKAESTRATIQTTLEEFQDHANDNGGYCLACGAEAFGCEPDARRYLCNDCGQREVYGAEEALIMGRVEFEEEDK